MQKKQDVPITIGKNAVFEDPLRPCYESLCAAIYYRAIFDVFEIIHVSKKNRRYKDILRAGNDALRFLQKDTYGMNIDYKSILRKMENENFNQKERYLNNELWNM